MASKYDPEISLAGDVIRLAVDDYESALFQMAIKKRLHFRGSNSSKKTDPEKIIKDCERFFRSKNFEQMSLGVVEGEDLIRRSKKEIAELAAVARKILNLESHRLALFQKAISAETRRRYIAKTEKERKGE